MLRPRETVEAEFERFRALREADPARAEELLRAAERLVELAPSASAERLGDELLRLPRAALLQWGVARMALAAARAANADAVRPARRPTGAHAALGLGRGGRARGGRERRCGLTRRGRGRSCVGWWRTGWPCAWRH